MQTVVSSICRMHDGLTRASFLLACAGAVYLTLVTALEVLQRYLLNNPAAWTADTLALAFAAITFLAMPQVTRARGHVAMTFLLDRLHERGRRLMSGFLDLLAAIVCFACGVAATQDMLKQAEQGTMMIAVTPIARWWVTAVIAYGLISMGLYFLRHGIASVSGQQTGRQVTS